MADPELLPLLYILIATILGLVAGGLAGAWGTRLRLQKGTVPAEEVEKNYVSRDLHRQTVETLARAEEHLQAKESELRELGKTHASLQADLKHLNRRLQQQQAHFEQLQEKAGLEFETLANRLLDQKAQSFSEQNQKELESVLKPLRERIKSFEEGMREQAREDLRDRASLKQEIHFLRELNQQVSADANNLAQALKGDQKVQGDWGEIQLQRLLEHAGLQEGTHFEAQESFRGSDGRQHRPDFIVKLPEDKHLVIDSKVSLTAYSRYFETDQEEERKAHLREHLKSLRQHIRELADKNYQNLYQINSPDYLLLFVPIEPAFALATREDGNIFLEALERNVVLVTTTTLLATMRTVSFIWKQERQKRSVQEIARQSGLLYDKFVGFVEDLQDIGQRLEQAHTAYGKAMNKLRDSPRYGDTLIGRAERIRQLGARAKKKLPEHLTEPGRLAANGHPEEEE